MVEPFPAAKREAAQRGPASPRSSPVERGKGVRIQVEQGAIFSWRLAAGRVGTAPIRAARRYFRMYRRSQHAHAREPNTVAAAIFPWIYVARVHTYVED